MSKMTDQEISEAAQAIMKMRGVEVTKDPASQDATYAKSSRKYKKRTRIDTAVMEMRNNNSVKEVWLQK